jgi:hypothetical protein
MYFVQLLFALFLALLFDLFSFKNCLTSARGRTAPAARPHGAAPRASRGRRPPRRTARRRRKRRRSPRMLLLPGRPGRPGTAAGHARRPRTEVDRTCAAAWRTGGRQGPGGTGAVGRAGAGRVVVGAALMRRGRAATW